MPELPEVETVTRALRPHLTGRCVTSVDVRIDRLREPVTVHQSVSILQCPIVAVSRRAKYILITMQNRAVIVMHLGMTGSCRLEADHTPLRKHDHVVFELDNSQSLRFNDPRRFGLIRVERLHADDCLPASLRSLPPEPLEDDFDGAYLYAVVGNRKRMIKSILLDSRLVAGVGNIYACEALFDAGIRPQVAGRRLSRRRCDRLADSLKKILACAVTAGGTTIADFRSVDGSEGKFAIQLRAYGREGKPCVRCEGGIRRVVEGGRSTFYCPRCQK